jgi:PAS domain S-box-containing protein
MKVRSLRHLLAIRSAWIAVVPFLLSALLGWFWLRPQMVADTEEHQRQLAEAIAARTEAFLLSSSDEIERTALVLSKGLVGDSKVQEYLDTKLALSSNLTSIAFTDSAGRITFITLPKAKVHLQQEMRGIDLSLTGSVRRVRKTGRPVWSDVYLSPVSGGLAVAYATPAADGVVLGEISLVQLSGFLKGIATHGKHSIFIIDRRGQVIADQEGRYTARQYNLTNLEIVREGLASGRPVTRGFSIEGDRVVGTLIRAPVLDWNILVSSPVELAYRSALTTTGIFATALCIALLLAAGLSLLISHFLAMRLEKLVIHARMIESGEDAGDWPKTPVSEFNLLGDALHSMANALRERENRLNGQLHFLQQLIDTIPVPVYYKDAGGVFQGCNTAFEALMGMPRSGILGKTVYELLPKERADIHHEADMALLRRPDVHLYEASGIYGDGESRDLIFSKATFVDADNRVAGIVGASMDITSRKRVEDALRESEEKFRVLAETSPAAIILHQGERFIYTNPATSGISGYSEEELLGMNFWEWCAKEDSEVIRRRSLARLRGEPQPPQYEHRLITRFCEEKWVLVSAGVTEYRGKPTLIATLLDITEAKKGEDRIKSALAEKIVLLKEVHHRVKNNMQIISSLLDLQTDSITDEQSRSCLRDGQNRIRSMALIHERLYQSKDFSSIDLGEYISDLSYSLFDSYAVESKRVSLSVDAGNISLDINRALPCALIINELVSNSLKHAFPDGRSGEISVRVGREEGRTTLEVADTGIGMPEGLDYGNTETLGLQLVNLLTKQLKGTVFYEGGQKGTVVVISFQGATNNKTEDTEPLT